MEEQRAAVRAPEPCEVQILLTAATAEDLRIGVFLRVLAATGVRRGEACALQWSDIDLERGVITVDKGVIAARGGAVVKEPKTRASVRSLACDEGTTAALVELRAEQERLALAAEENLLEDSSGFSAYS